DFARTNPIREPPPRRETAKFRANEPNSRGFAVARKWRFGKDLGDGFARARGAERTQSVGGLRRRVRLLGGGWCVEVEARLGADSDVEADSGGPDFPVVAVPAGDDARALQAVEHLLDVGGDAVLVFGDQVELAADEAEDAS